MAEFIYANDLVMPGLKEYRRGGSPVTDYPFIQFELEDHLEKWKRVDLSLHSKPMNPGIKYYLKQGDDRIYLISEDGSASIHRIVMPGNTLSEHLEFIAEIPTKLGNILVKEVYYDLDVSNVE